jgi:uncharacterized protein
MLPMLPPAADPASCRAGFERRWGHLTRPHVRALAWLLDAPGLLDPNASQWRGKIAPDPGVAPDVAAWLDRLEADPAPLEAMLGSPGVPGAHFPSRLGLYAEKLMACHFAHQGKLVAHGLQVRADKTDTVGEFDFLLRDGAALVHLELATKFYLLEGDAAAFAARDGAQLDCLVGPNLADSLGAKMRKIIGRQLKLGSHPAAQLVLPQAVAAAQAMVKGWLFYRHGAVPPLAGIAAAHCHGFWCTLDELPSLNAEHFVVLPRLQWLAPLKIDASAGVLSRAALHEKLRAQFSGTAIPMPVLVASVRQDKDWLLEQDRGFIVPPAWRARAAERRQAGSENGADGIRDEQ